MRALLVAGLGFGDEGKGATVDALTRYYSASLVVRYNGGSQAGHNVVTPEGQHHTFSQFGAGTLAGAATHLSRFMLIDPMNMMNEARHLEGIGIKSPFSSVTVDPRAIIITPFHKVANQEEAIAEGTHHTCGLGVGFARRDYMQHGDKVLFAEDLLYPLRTVQKLEFLASLYKVTKANLDNLTADYGRWATQIVFSNTHYVLRRYSESTVIFEGAQGILLDERYGLGEERYRTWSDCTFKNAEILLKEVGRDSQVIKLGVTRTYHTRHGDGPFPTEDSKLNFSEPYNGDSGFQGKFRQGSFDRNALNYALAMVGDVDALVVNHLDYIPLDLFPLEQRAPLAILGYGPTYKNRLILKNLDELLKLKEKHAPINDHGSACRNKNDQQAAREEA
jgi:adenylosuccinate synthase